MQLCNRRTCTRQDVYLWSCILIDTKEKYLQLVLADKLISFVMLKEDKLCYYLTWSIYVSILNPVDKRTSIVILNKTYFSNVILKSILNKGNT